MEGVDFYDNLVYGLGSSQGRRQSFFQRSESTLCLGCPPPDPFNTPMSESLPLADQPHLLQPNARREDLFGIPKQPITIPPSGVEPLGVNSPLELPPTMLGLSPHKILSQTGGVSMVNDENVTQAQPQEPLISNSDYDSQNATAAKFMDQPSMDVIESSIPTVFETEQQANNKTTHIVVKADVHAEPISHGNDTPCSSKDVAGCSGEGSSNTAKRKASDQYPSPASETFGNIFMQLKKKNYYDQYEEDNRGYEKREGKNKKINKSFSFNVWYARRCVCVLQKVPKICPAQRTRSTIYLKWISIAKTMTTITVIVTQILAINNRLKSPNICKRNNNNLQPILLRHKLRPCDHKLLLLPEKWRPQSNP